MACGGHTETITELGHLLWPKLAAAYIERRLAPGAPRDEAGLDAFQDMAKAAERLEDDAAATGCCPPTPSVFRSYLPHQILLWVRQHLAAVHMRQHLPSAVPKYKFGPEESMIFSIVPAFSSWVSVRNFLQASACKR